jgi:hypothetical protein
MLRVYRDGSQHFFRDVGVEFRLARLENVRCAALRTGIARVTALKLKRQFDFRRVSVDSSQAL